MMSAYPVTNITLEELQKFYNNRLIVLSRSVPVDDVHDWCDDNSVAAHFIGRYYNDDIWYVVYDADLVMFKLRWA